MSGGRLIQKPTEVCLLPKTPYVGQRARQRTSTRQRSLEGGKRMNWKLRVLIALSLVWWAIVVPNRVLANHVDSGGRLYDPS